MFLRLHFTLRKPKDTLDQNANNTNTVKHDGNTEPPQTDVPATNAPNNDNIPEPIDKPSELEYPPDKTQSNGIETSMLEEITVGKLHNKTIEIPLNFTKVPKGKRLKGKVKLRADYVINSAYDITLDSNVPQFCEKSKVLDTSFFTCKNSTYLALYGRYKTVQADSVCNKFNDCNNCSCNEPHCDCRAGSGSDEDEAFCKGDLRKVTDAILYFFAIFCIAGIVCFVSMKHLYNNKRNENSNQIAMTSLQNTNLTPQIIATQEPTAFKSLVIELIENLKSIAKKKTQNKSKPIWNEKKLSAKLFARL